MEGDSLIRGREAFSGKEEEVEEEEEEEDLFLLRNDPSSISLRDNLPLEKEDDLPIKENEEFFTGRGVDCVIGIEKCFDGKVNLLAE